MHEEINIQMQAVSSCDVPESIDVESTKLDIIRAVLYTFMGSLENRKESSFIKPFIIQISNDNSGGNLG